uniref:G domain-containing protein n=1 Tax=Oncorhynchus kisutch TaxID=8019 RepID=A0A8C7MM89_ONCKI
RGYISKDYAQTGQVINDDKAFLYSITDQREKQEGSDDTVAASDNTPDGQYGFTDRKHGLNVGVLWFLNGNKAQVSCITGNHYKVNAAGMHGNDLVLTECEVHRVLIDHLAKAWRNALWTSENKEQLKQNIQNYRLEVKSVAQASVLLVGQVWAGMSSFFNTINMQGHRWQCRQKPHHTGYECVRVCFNPMAPLQPDVPGYRKHATLNDQIHCVVYVMDASKVSQMSAKMMDKVIISHCMLIPGIPQLVLLTKVDKACRIASLNIPVSCILPVNNYSQECEQDQDIDILLLRLNQMLNYADSFFKNQLEKQEELSVGRQSYNTTYTYCI